jgi:hypothetical protein
MSENMDQILDRSHETAEQVMDNLLAGMTDKPDISHYVHSFDSDGKPKSVLSEPMVTDLEEVIKESRKENPEGPPLDDEPQQPQVSKYGSLPDDFTERHVKTFEGSVVIMARPNMSDDQALAYAEMVQLMRHVVGDNSVDTLNAVQRENRALRIRMEQMEAAQFNAMNRMERIMKDVLDQVNANQAKGAEQAKSVIAAFESASAKTLEENGRLVTGSIDRTKTEIGILRGTMSNVLDTTREAFKGAVELIKGLLALSPEMAEAIKENAALQETLTTVMTAVENAEHTRVATSPLNKATAGGGTQVTGNLTLSEFMSASASRRSQLVGIIEAKIGKPLDSSEGRILRNGKDIEAIKKIFDKMPK